MQFIVTYDEHRAVQVKCPVCDSLLVTIKEQAKGDERVHIMLHPKADCKWSKQTLRVDRMSGYAEPWPEEAQCESSDETRTSTTTSAPSPCTTSRNVTRHTPRGTPAAGLGRIPRFRERG